MQDEEDAEILSPKKAALSASVKAVIMSSLATTDDASDLAVAILEAYGYQGVTSLREYSGLDYLNAYLGAAFSGDCVLLVESYASDSEMDSEEAEDLPRTIHDLRQVASFDFGGSTYTFYICILSPLQSPRR